MMTSRCCDLTLMRKRSRDAFYSTLRVGPENLSDVRHQASVMMIRLGLSQSMMDYVLLAVEEAVQNVIRYGYRPEDLPGRIALSAWRENDDLLFEIRDYALPVDFSEIRPRSWNPSHPGGLGLKLIYAAMDEVIYLHAPNGEGNLLRMRKHLE